MTRDKHYTAVVTIDEVTTGDSDVRSGNLQDPRGKQEITRIVLKAKSLDVLREKIAAHVELVSEE